jgi:ABC-type cobalamin/Fe3+-siderophores transport system ATPase subunit
MFAGVNFGKLKRINLHVIFSDELSVETIQSQFLNTLEQSYYLEKDGVRWERAITFASVKELGEKIKASVPPDKLSEYGSDLDEGFNNLNLDENQIFDSLKKDCFNGKYFIALGKTEWDELAWTDSSIATKKSIINKADIIFTAAESINSFNRAKQKLNSQGLDKCILLDCSDAHFYSQSIEKDRIGNCFTWIKADTTFEGLKQIIYEPEERVKIQEVNPELLKKHYKIRSLEISNSDNNLLQNQIVDFNSGLVSLIGGRGSGKTSLLNIINHFNYRSDPEFISWLSKNGDADIKLTLVNKDFEDEVHLTKISSVENESLPIYYLSQNDIENFSRDENSVRETFLNALGITERLFYYNDQRVAAEALIVELEKLDNELDEIYTKYKNLTSKEGVGWVDFNTYKEHRETVLEKQKNKYTTIQTKETLEKISKLSIKGISLKKILESPKESEIRTTIETLNRLIDDYNKSMIIYEGQDNTAKEIPKYNIDNYNIKINANKQSVEKELEKLRLELKPELVKLQQLGIVDYKNIEEAIKKINIEVSQLEYDDIRLKNIRTAQKNCKTALSGCLNLYKDQIEKAKNDINSNFEAFNNDKGNLFNVIFSEISVSGSSYFDEKDFIERLNSHFLSKKEECIEAIVRKLEKDNPQSFFLSFSEIWSCIEDKSNFKKGDNYNYYNFLRLIFIDCMKHIKVQPKIEMNSCELGNMSGGQQATLILKLKLASEGLEKDIIILDQPENHLDNAFISSELVNLLMVLKKEKQVIIASHNANAVVSADSEQIIVSRMDVTGDKTYFTGSIENPLIKDKIINILEGGKTAFENRKKKYNF